MKEETLKHIIREAGNSSRVDPQDRFIEDRAELQDVILKLRTVGLKIGLTQGTFDMFHVGHTRYLSKARARGDILVLGLDNDEKARHRKGENRPVVPFEERVEVMTTIRIADIVVPKRKGDPKWDLIKMIKPDVLIAVEGTYSEEEVRELGEFCSEVVVLPRQAATSTSAKIRKLVLDGAETIAKRLAEAIPAVVHQVYQEMRGEK